MRAGCRLLGTSGLCVPVIAVVSEAGLSAVSTDWRVEDTPLLGAGPAETEVRLRLLAAKKFTPDPADRAAGGEVVIGDPVIDEATYTCRVRGRAVALTYHEFGLLNYLAHHPDRVFSREQLLREVWGHDYLHQFSGGTRAVDDTTRRLRRKLGGEHAMLIGTVHNVEYKCRVQVLSPRDHQTSFRRPVHPRTEVLSAEIDALKTAGCARIFLDKASGKKGTPGRA